MANKFDWIVVPDTASVTTITPGSSYAYDLVNMTINEALVYQSRDWGINLGWGDPASSSNIRFQRNWGTGAIEFGEMFAIGVRGGKWLYYQVRENGINLGWSETPKFEWRFDSPDGKTGDVPVMSLVGLYNSVEQDWLTYDPRTWGINLKWLKDEGRFNEWGDLRDIAEKVSDIKKKIGEWFD